MNSIALFLIKLEFIITYNESGPLALFMQPVDPFPQPYFESNRRKERENWFPCQFEYEGRLNKLKRPGKLGYGKAGKLKL